MSDEQQLQNIASKVRYVGSPEHKDTPSFAGEIRPRADASICPRELRNRPEDITKWLKDAISAGNIGAPWEGEFPRYVWYRAVDGSVYEARLVNRGSGEYKGYPLYSDEIPDWM